MTHPGQLAPEQRAKALGIDKHPLGPPAGGWIDAADHDHLSEAYAATGDLDPVEIRDTEFAYGLDVVLDGLALRLPRAV
ncbi:hypothetical protein OHS33_33935 [Streptomyces sp. NBC_00536]|uniref:hypothetical protein n=1 Tax=Streptomyces sp. NBC_00536 TaxID=2975769 RepID=UPI002E821FA9|nr:hypothetical protein [Streptomyces sp. NBC_00536]WUC82929.1 hypothetical protein OHS33_33935 [Streptomyces sp. NBC_00536]